MVSGRVAGPSAALCLLASAALACGEKPVTEPPEPPTDSTPSLPWVSISAFWVPATVNPGDTSILRVRVVPRIAGAKLSYVRLRMGAPFDTVLSVPIRQPGALELTLTMVVEPGPWDAVFSVVVMAAIGAGGDTAQADLTIADTRAPRIELTAPYFVEPGDSLTVRLSAEDNGGLAATVMTVTGAAQYADSVVHTLDLTVSRDVIVPIPASTPLRDSAIVEVIALDWKGYADTARLRAGVTDLHQPEVIGWVVSPPPDSTSSGVPRWLTGDTVHIAIEATDNRGLVRMGYTMSYPVGDTVAASGTSAQYTASFRVQSGWHVLDARVWLFAEDSVGNRGDFGLPVSFFSGRRRPIIPLPAAPFDAVADFVYDSAGGRVFLAVPDSLVVSVLSLVSMTYEPSIPLPFAPQSLDLTESGNRLVVTFPQTPYLGLVDPVSSRVDTVRLDGIDPSDRYPGWVSVAANGKAIVALEGPGGGGPFVVIDLHSGGQRWEPVGAGQGRVARSEDRSVVAGLAQEYGYVYAAAADTIAGPYLGSTCTHYPTLRVTATYLMNRYILCDAAFGFLGVLSGDDVAGSTFTADGNAAYLWFSYGGYNLVSIPDGAVIERVLLPYVPTDLYDLPGQEALLVFLGSRPAALIDLR